MLHDTDGSLRRTVVSEEVRRFQAIGSFTKPTLPTEEWFKVLRARILAIFGKESATPIVADDRMQTLALETIDDVAAPPARGPLLDDLQATLAPWLSDASATSKIKLIVLPPCDREDVVGSWAKDNGHQVLLPPEREMLLSNWTVETIPDLSGDGVLVIPQLERWFLRHSKGLAAVRALLARIDAVDRRCIVGCNSWAWAFLVKAAGADMILPVGLTFEPFDADRLHRWIGRLAAESGRAIVFRMPRTGEDVLATDEAGKLKSDFFKTLAARSLGIPWVAWHLWRLSLRSNVEKKSQDGDTIEDRDEQILWLAALDEFTLPDRYEESALLVLHALLLHGPLTAAELRLVIPVVGESNILPALISIGLVDRQGEAVACRPAAYPSIRSGLFAAGIPVDGL